MLLRLAILTRNIIQMMIKLNYFVRYVARFIRCGITAQPKVNKSIQRVCVRTNFTAL